MHIEVVHEIVKYYVIIPKPPTIIRKWLSNLGTVPGRLVHQQSDSHSCIVSAQCLCYAPSTECTLQLTSATPTLLLKLVNYEGEQATNTHRKASTHLSLEAAYYPDFET